MRRTQGATVAILALALMVGCTTFDDIEPNVCGNGIIEVGEDCDRDDPTCVRCAQVCETQADCPSAAYTCGADGLCAAPSGRLADPSPLGTFPIDDFVVTDLDRDGIGDLLGTAPTSLVVRYGDALARLDRGETRSTPSHAGPTAFGDVDGDGSLDATFTTADGLITYASKFGPVAPLAVRASFTTDAEDLDIRTVSNLGDRALLALIASNSEGTSALGIIDELNTSGDFFTLPCAARLMSTVHIDDLPLDQIDVYAVSERDFVVSLVIDTVPRQLCTLAIHLDTTNLNPALQTWEFHDITPVTFGAPDTKPILIDIDFDVDRCPGLLDADTGALRFLEGTMSAGAQGHCTLPDGAGVAVPSFGGKILGRLPLEPGFPFVARDLLIAREGLYARGFFGEAWGPVYESQRALRGGTGHDLDRDGKIDGILYGETDDVDIIYRRDNADTGFPSFVVYRLDTTNSVSRSKIGDYDANGFPDIAMIEEFGDFVQMSVAFGQVGYLRQPVSVATFESVYELVVGSYPSSEDLAGLTDDLIVLRPPAEGTSINSVSVLSGSTLGTLIPYYDPRIDNAMGVPDADQDRRRTQLQSVMVGAFSAGPRAALGMIAFGADVKNDVAPLMWRMPGTDFGPDATTHPGISTTGFADCERRTRNALCLSEARYISWPTGPTSPDVVYAVDREHPPHAVRFDPSLPSVEAISLDPLVAALTDKAPVRSLARADLDGDDVFELVVVAADGASSRPSALVVCDVENHVPTSCTDVMPAIVQSAAAQTAGVRVCTDAVASRMQFADRTTEATRKADLVLSCRTDGGTVILRADRSGADVSMLASTRTAITTLRAGDVTGDGLDDVLVVEEARGVESMSVFRQCSSRDVALCGGQQ